MRGSDVRDTERIDMIVKSLRDQPAGGSTMIFVNTAEAAVDLADALRVAEPSMEFGEFHKLMKNIDKQANLQAFREGKLAVLICTDAAARGLDLSTVRHVIQAEFALNVVQHLHRIGRASRAGKKGSATMIVDERGADLAASIQGGAGTTQEGGRDEGVERSFSRKRGFRAKLKKDRSKRRSVT